MPIRSTPGARRWSARCTGSIVDTEVARDPRR